MTITVKWFAMLRDVAGAEACALAVEPGTTAEAVRAALLARYPGLRHWLPYVRLALNREYGSWDAVLRDGDELALIPPVSGG